MTLSALTLIYSDMAIALRKYKTNFIKYFKWKEHRHQTETPAIFRSLDKVLDFGEPRWPHLKENMDVGSGTCPTGCFEMIYVRHPVVPDVPSEKFPPLFFLSPKHPGEKT